MKPKQRIRTVGSVSNELLKKSREAALAAVQVFNNPAITFKSEIFVVMMVISWTYLLHAHFRKQGIEYRYFKVVGTRKRFDKTSKGAFKYWELERCLNDQASPVDKAVANNLRFLVGLRHEIEHQMTNRLDEHLSARFQACCLNYNGLIKRLFGDDFGIDKHLSFSLQFSAINTDQWEALHDAEGLPPNIRAFINAFDSALTEAEFNDPRFIPCAVRTQDGEPQGAGGQGDRVHQGRLGVGQGRQQALRRRQGNREGQVFAQAGGGEDAGEWIPALHHAQPYPIVEGS